jgi:hypothetical protein
VADRIVFAPPPQITQVARVMLIGGARARAVCYRARSAVDENSSRSPISNLNGLVVVLATFFAATQAFNLVIPEAGLPFVLFNVFLFVLLLNTMAGSHGPIVGAPEPRGRHGRRLRAEVRGVGRTLRAG